MNSATSIWQSSVGRKYIMGITGLLLIGFVLVHMLGNLQVFGGQDLFNSYAAMLKGMPALLWGARIGLMVVVVLHVVTAFQLRKMNLGARPAPYVAQDTIQASVSSRVMILSGTLILMYIIGHLLHFTVGVIYPEYFQLKDAQGRHDVYSMLVLSFQHPVVSLLYIGAMLLLWSHLSHGISSVFQSLGVRGLVPEKWVDKLGPILSTVIVLGYIAIPAAVLLGIVGLPAQSVAT